jgi:flagellar hook-associated protein 1 FlgK
MAGSALMSLGLRALTANYAALQATGHNIANANTEGYSRQSVQLETAGGQYTGAGFFGKGVNVQTVARAHSAFLTREAAGASAVAAGDEVRATQLQMLEQVFPLGEDGIGYAAGEMFNAFVDVANKPGDLSARQVVLTRAGELAARFASAGAQLDELQAGVTMDLKAGVAAVNGLAEHIASLNNQIAAARGQGNEPNDLMDQRDLAIEQLSRHVQVTTLAAADGSMSVFIGGGQRLVLGGEAARLVAMPDRFDPWRVQIGIASATGLPTELPPSSFVGGEFAGLLRFQNDDLVDARNLLGQMAAAIAGAVNAQQALGVDLTGNGSAGAAIFATGGPRVAPASSNAMLAGVPVASYVNGAGERVPSVGVTIVDPVELQASDYELVADPALPAGSYRLTRLADGVSSTVADGDVVDGLRIDIAAPAPAAGDRFLLQPVANAARDMATVLADPRGIAAASPVVATVAAGNTGTASVAGVRATSTAINPDLTATITFNNATGGFDWTLVDSTGTLPATSGSGTWTAGQPIVLNGFSLDLAGVPASGDVLTVQRTQFPASDNGNAKALLALGTAGLVGRRTLAGGAVVPAASVTDAYAVALAEVGVRVQSAQRSAEQSATIATEAKAAKAARSGVNLDEEAARLIQFQQSYQAAAKVLQIAQQVFDTLLDIAAGR